MKTIKMTLALCALAAMGKAQPQNTGQSLYNHAGTNALLTSGTYVNANPGFVMAGYLPNISFGSYNFLVDKVDPDGTFGSGTGFSNGYAFYDAPGACNATCFRQRTNCFGVSIVESPNTGCGNIDYALATVFDTGLLFATLDNSGDVETSAFYTFPQGAKPTYKPLIANAANGGYYVCGSYHFNGIEYVYAMRLNQTGSAMWSNVYDLGIVLFQAHDLVEDLRAGFDQLAIVGTIGTGADTDGFLITLNGTNGSPIVQQALASGQVINESNSSITLSTNSGGYIVGGSTDMSGNTNRAWIADIDPTGTTFNWSSRIQPSTDNTAGEIISVAERFSSTYGAWEYYGLTVSQKGMMVLKVDQNGNPFSANPNNEFLYNDGAGNNALSGDFSYLDDPSLVNLGIHVFGTNQNTPGEFFLDQACFNGVTAACGPPNQILTQMNSDLPGPTVTYNFGVNINGGLKRCRGYEIVTTPLNYGPNQPCYMFTTPGSGDNSRHAGTTGLNENNPQAATMSLYPNPTNNSADLSYSAAKAGDVKITISDVLGKEIKTLDSGYKKEGANTLHIDLNNLNIQTGIYFINVTANGTTTQQKIIYTKN